MRAIALTQGKWALVSDKDYKRVSLYRWHLTVHGYAGANMLLQKREVVLMHRFILDHPKGLSIDHKNLGCFDTAEQAGAAYDRASKKFHGKFSNPNKRIHELGTNKTKNRNRTTRRGQRV